ncbi:hypothetical protein NDU88_001064 [Pleurodeles waltl]|uniref:Uncharacterized protein n=1 Tax=Pleurodeles waltl TaxID=8319 RepID=A0AAV7URR5_PLEWA|nr:hypothetical protein NDU88_001064 [Pleurodeles waltl]
MTERLRPGPGAGAGRGGIASPEQLPVGDALSIGVPAAGERARGQSKIQARTWEAPALNCEQASRGQQILYIRSWRGSERAPVSTRGYLVATRALGVCLRDKQMRVCCAGGAPPSKWLCDQREKGERKKNSWATPLGRDLACPAGQRLHFTRAAYKLTHPAQRPILS